MQYRLVLYLIFDEQSTDLVLIDGDHYLVLCYSQSQQVFSRSVSDSIQSKFEEKQF
jgi:hypothetical protein